MNIRNSNYFTTTATHTQHHWKLFSGKWGYIVVPYRAPGLNSWQFRGFLGPNKFLPSRRSPLPITWSHTSLLVAMVIKKISSLIGHWEKKWFWNDSALTEIFSLPFMYLRIWDMTKRRKLSFSTGKKDQEIITRFCSSKSHSSHQDYGQNTVDDLQVEVMVEVYDSSQQAVTFHEKQIFFFFLEYFDFVRKSRSPEQREIQKPN